MYRIGELVVYIISFFVALGLVCVLGKLAGLEGKDLERFPNNLIVVFILIASFFIVGFVMLFILGGV